MDNNVNWMGASNTTIKSNSATNISNEHKNHNLKLFGNNIVANVLKVLAILSLIGGIIGAVCALTYDDFIVASIVFGACAGGALVTYVFGEIIHLLDDIKRKIK